MRLEEQRGEHAYEGEGRAYGMEHEQDGQCFHYCIDELRVTRQRENVLRYRVTQSWAITVLEAGYDAVRTNTPHTESQVGRGCSGWLTSDSLELDREEVDGLDDRERKTNKEIKKERNEHHHTGRDRDFQVASEWPGWRGLEVQNAHCVKQPLLMGMQTTTMLGVGLLQLGTGERVLQASRFMLLWDFSEV